MGLRSLLLWTALDSLFGPADQNHIKKRLAKRMSRFLRSSGPQADRLYEQVHRAYEDERCPVAHGDGPWLTDPSEISRLLDRTEGWVHESLVRILTSAEHLAKFGSDREGLLQSIEAAIDVGLNT